MQLIILGQSGKSDLSVEGWECQPCRTLVLYCIIFKQEKQANTSSLPTTAVVCRGSTLCVMTEMENKFHCGTKHLNRSLILIK